jgi:hypothetical protein
MLRMRADASDLSFCYSVGEFCHAPDASRAAVPKKLLTRQEDP